MRWVLQQKGAKVRGESYRPDGTVGAAIEGVVNGEVTWRGERYRGEVTAGTVTWVRPKPSEHASFHARLWHPWLRINRVTRVMLHTQCALREG
jgi:hypothetical protein